MQLIGIFSFNFLFLFLQGFTGGFHGNTKHFFLLRDLCLGLLHCLDGRSNRILRRFHFCFIVRHCFLGGFPLLFGLFFRLTAFFDRFIGGANLRQQLPSHLDVRGFLLNQFFDFFSFLFQLLQEVLLLFFTFLYPFDFGFAGGDFASEAFDFRFQSFGFAQNVDGLFQSVVQAELLDVTFDLLQCFLSLVKFGFLFFDGCGFGLFVNIPLQAFFHLLQCVGQLLFHGFKLTDFFLKLL